MRRYLYLFTEPFQPTVIDSQVVEPLALLDRLGLHFDLISSVSAGMMLRDRHTLLQRRREVAARLQGRVLVVPHYRADLPVGLAAATAAVIAAAGPALLAREVVIHARSVKAAAIAMNVARLHPGVRLVLDVRGHLAELGMMAAQGERGAAVMARVAPVWMQEAVRSAAAIIAVSGPLRDWLVRDFGADAGKIRVVPCLASDETFRFDPALRAEVRQREGLDGRVIVFPGATGKWHHLPATLRVVRTLMEADARVTFVALTPGLDAMRSALAEAGIPDGRARVLRVPHAEVNGWLNAADAGILLRARHPVNEVAAPTKFAEYLLAGLPVLINEGIGDYSAFVRDHGTGVLLNEDDPASYLRPFARLLDGQDDARRAAIAAIGRAHFAKESVLPALAELYRTV